MADLTVDDIALRYGDNEILKGVSVTVPPGKVVALLGPSGSGKTTLLRAVAALETPHRRPHHAAQCRRYRAGRNADRTLPGAGDAVRRRVHGQQQPPRGYPGRAGGGARGDRGDGRAARGPRTRRRRGRNEGDRRHPPGEGDAWWRTRRQPYAHDAQDADVYRRALGARARQGRRERARLYLGAAQARNLSRGVSTRRAVDLLMPAASTPDCHRPRRRTIQ